MKHILFKLFFLFLGAQFLETSCQKDAALKNFLRAELEKFPAWIAEKGLDPSPVIPREIRFQYSQGFVNITKAKMRNHVLSGHSNVVFNLFGKTSLIFGGIFINIDISPPGTIIVTGEYEIEGTIFSTIPINGTGRFNYICFHPYHRGDEEINFEVNNFGISKDGYVDLSAGTIRKYMICGRNPIVFEGLSAGGYEAEVGDVLRDRYESLRPKFPLPGYLQSYVEELLAKTPISEIIDATTTWRSETTPRHIKTNSDLPSNKFRSM